MNYRHALVDVLEVVEDMRADVDDSPEVDGEFEDGFEQGYLAALGNMEEIILEMLGLPTVVSH